MNAIIDNAAQAQAEAPQTAQALNALTASIMAGYHTQHNANDTHGTITASGSISERGRTTAIGDWINVPFSTAAFTNPGAGNSWVPRAPTPGASFFVISYTLVGSTMFFNLDVPAANLTVATASNLILVAMPPGFRVAGNAAAGNYIGRTSYGHWSGVNGGSAVGGFIFATPGQTILGLQKTDASNFAADAANGMTVRGQIFFEVAAV